MKKIILSILFGGMALGAYAKTVRETGTFVSACGVTWSYVIHYDDSGSAIDQMMSEFDHLSPLMDKADAACGTNVSVIVN